jgi:hypothetical protein
MKKTVITYIFLVFFMTLTLSSAQAVKVALIVKNSTSLSNIHEKKINNILTAMGFDVTKVDKDSTVDYSQFDLIVVAGRPGNVYSYEHLDSFVADLPVNDNPTIAIDSSYPDDWGWITPVGISTLSSTEIQKVKIISNSTPITNVYSLGQTVEVHIIAGKTMIDLIGGKYRLTPIASVVTNENNPVIAIAESGTELYNGQKNKCRIVFFGITNPLYWSDDTISMFINSIDWVLYDADTDGFIDCKDNCPSIPNPDQKDTDFDGKGDVCDNCPFVYNPDQSDIDLDKIGDLCDNDIDGDGITNNLDNCPLKFNPDQKDKDFNGIGDVCDILPYQVFLDVDNDSVNETAINANNITDDGFEVYEDPNSNTKAKPIDGDFDGMTDWLIDIKPYGTYEKYWDPDDGILTNVNRTDSDYYIDTDGDGKPDIIYNSFEDAFVVRRDVDSDSNLEEALDHDFDGSFDEYRDTNGHSMLLHIVDGDKDNKNDFILGIDGINITKPARYWDPDDNILTDIVERDLNDDGISEYLIDVDGDGKFDIIFNGDMLHDLPDLTVDSISIISTSPTEGDNIKINANIKNIGEYDASHFTVEFKLDGTFVSSKTISLAASDSTDLEFIWYNAQKDSHTIEIITDSENNISESNEGNNNKSTSISVSARPSVGGGISVYYSGNASFIGFPDKVEADIGDKIKLSGVFKSDLSYGLTNVEFSIESEGLNPAWYKISPTGYSRIDQEESRDVSVEITIPEDARIYTFYIKLKASADSEDGRKTFEKAFTLMLKERIVVTTTTTTTTVPETTTTTTIPEEKPSPLTGFYAAIKAYSIYIAIIIIIAIIVILLKVFKVKFEFVNNKGQYTYGKGWKAPKLKFKFFSTASLKTLLTKW